MKKILLRGMALTGIAILFWLCSLFLESHTALKWPHTQGQVISSSITIDHLPRYIDLNPEQIRWYGVEVQYKYTVGEFPYISNRVTFQTWGSRSPKSALKLMNKYRRLRDVTVYYNPEDPQQSVLEPANVGDILFPLIIGALLVFLGLSFLFDQNAGIKLHGAENYLRSGNIYRKLGKLKEASDEFTKIIETSPYLAQGYKSRGEVYLQLEYWDKAISDLSQARSIDPTDALVYLNRAQSYLGNKQYDLAWDDIQKAMEMGIKVKPHLLEKIKKGLPNETI